MLTIAPAAFISMWLSAWLGAKVGLLDYPDARKQHSHAIPLTGGIAVFLTILLGHVALGIPPYTYPTLVIAVILFLLGIFDDFRHIDPWVRLGIQYVAGVALGAQGGIAIHNVGDLLGVGDIRLLFMTVPLTALAFAGLSNAYNMIDGLDGLAAALIALPLVILYTLALASVHPMADTVLLMLVPLSVFLLFNLGPDTRWLPKVFLGDGGSVTLGFLTTASLVYFSQGESALIRPVTALWLVAVPLMDMLATMLRRARSGQKLMQADRRHLHHALLDRGLQPRQVLVVMVGYALLCALCGLGLEAIPPYLSLAFYCLLFAGHCLFVIREDRRKPVDPGRDCQSDQP